MKVGRVIVIIVALAAISGAGAWFGGYIPGGNEQDPMEGLVDRVERRDIKSELTLTGEIVPAVQVEVKSEVGGKVKAIHVAAGQTVSKGDLLMTIDDTELLSEKAGAETEIAGAELLVDKNRGNYERAKQLFEEKLISKEVFANLESDLAIAENTYEKAERRLQIIEDKLSKTRIESPADGTILSVMVNEGQVVVSAASVNSGTALLQVADLSRLLINSHVNQMDAAKIEVGSEMKIRRRPGQAASSARVEFIAPLATVKNNIKGFELQALIRTTDASLKPGMSVAMVVPVAKSEDTLAVPIGAVFRDDDEEVVYVRKGNQTERRKVRLGVSNYSYAEIVDGLQEGEEVLLVKPASLSGKS